MNKQVEQIKAEVERRIATHKLNVGCSFGHAQERIEELEELLSFIDSPPVPVEPSIQDIVDKHFYEMIGMEPASKDLEEAAEHFAFHQTCSGDMEYIAENEKEAFKAGANWQKQQMMKNTHSAEINYWNQRGLSIRLEDVEVEDLAEEGDKVKIIIIKED